MHQAPTQICGGGGGDWRGEKNRDEHFHHGTASLPPLVPSSPGRGGYPIERESTGARPDRFALLNPRAWVANRLLGCLALATSLLVVLAALGARSWYRRIERADGFVGSSALLGSLSGSLSGALSGGLSGRLSGGLSAGSAAGSGGALGGAPRGSGSLAANLSSSLNASEAGRQPVWRLEHRRSGERSGLQSLGGGGPPRPSSDKRLFVSQITSQYAQQLLAGSGGADGNGG
ncbi:hypothetical protein Ctob_004294, partial [Chrysochromulina tobinii]